MSADACNTAASPAKVVMAEHKEMSTIVDLTPKAAEKLKEFMKIEKKENYGLRIAVVAGGCSGNTTNMSFEEHPLSSDIKLELLGIKIFVDKMSEQYVQGSTIDYVEGLNGSGFAIQNPNVKSGCGCGSSQSY